MSAEKTIATLVGKLRFDVDSGPLLRFEKLLDNISNKMKALEAQAKRLDKSLSIKAASNKGNSTRNSLSREFRLERALAAAKKETFRLELEQQKLKYAGQKEAERLSLSSLKVKQAQAVAAEKEAKASLQRAKAAGIEQRTASSLAESKLRQERLAAALANTQQKTVLLQQKELANASLLQRAELALQAAQEKGRRLRQREEERAADRAARAAKAQQTEQRQTERHAQAQQRFQWQQARQQRWEANKDKRRPVGFGAGLDVMDFARSNPLLTALTSLTAAVMALEARIKATSNRVSDSEQYMNVLEQAGGSHPENQRFVRKEFFRIADKYGTSVDMEAAKDFRTAILTATSGGKMSLDSAIKQFETQSAAFRGAGMNREEIARALIQLRQVRAKGVGDTEDFKTFLEAAPLLGDAIGNAWAERTGFKGPAADIQGALLKAIPKGELLAKDFNTAFESFVRNNQGAIDKQSKSIQAAQTRLENAKFIQQNQIDQSEELKKAIHERIKAEGELTQAMQPVNEALAKFDAALISATASVLNYYFKDKGVEELKTKLEEAQTKYDKTSNFSENHPARLIAANDLAEAKRALLDAQLKAGQQIKGDAAPRYLLNEGEKAKQAVSPFLQGLDKSLMQLSSKEGSPLGMLPISPQASTEAIQQVIENKVTNNTDARSTITNNNTFQINGSTHSPDQIADAIEHRMEAIARKSWEDSLHSTRVNLVEVRK